MTALEMRSQFWRLLSIPAGDPDGTNNPLVSAGRFSIAELKEYLTDGVRELWRQCLPCTPLLASTTISLVAGTEVYDYGSATFWRWSEDAPTIAGKPVMWRTLGELDQLEDDNLLLDTYLYEAGVEATSGGVAQLGVRPVPSSAATLKLYYYRQPQSLADLSDGDEYRDLPAQYHRAVAYWAALLFAGNRIEAEANYPVDTWGTIFANYARRLRQDARIESQRNQPKQTLLGFPSASWMEVGGRCCE